MPFWSKALWRYTNSGIELGINYRPYDRVAANIHVGSTLGGRLKVANHDYEHRQRFNLDPAPYAGAEVDVNF